jgi:hypothetical protein
MGRISLQVVPRGRPIRRKILLVAVNSAIPIVTKDLRLRIWLARSGDRLDAFGATVAANKLDSRLCDWPMALGLRFQVGSANGWKTLFSKAG